MCTKISCIIEQLHELTMDKQVYIIQSVVGLATVAIFYKVMM